MTLKDSFLSSFERFKDRVAFNQPFLRKDSLEWKVFTYREFKELVFRFLKYLTNEISCGDRVILYAENSVYWCAAYIGIILRGAIAIPIDAETDRETLENIINDSEAPIVLYSSKTEPNVAGYKGFNVEDIERLPPFLDTDKFSLPEVSADTIASIIYTSGTTGIPKAVMLSHGNFIFEIEAGIKTGIIKKDENVLCLLPLHHTYPFVCNFFVPFCLGATITFSPYLRGPDIIRIIKNMKITSLIAVPQILEMMRFRIVERLKGLPFFIKPFVLGLKSLSSFLRRNFDLNIGRYIFFFLHLKTGFQLRFITSGGARLDPEVMKDLEAFGFTIIEGYGLTETSPVATFNPVRKRKPGSVGKPLEGVELKIVEPDKTGIGEIAIKGPLVMKGYYKNQELTMASIKDGWFFTGDLGYIDKDGYLFITGRKKDVIVLPSGKTIYPEDVEERYKRAIPIIREVCILDSMEAVIVPDLEYARLRGIVNIYSTLKWEIDAVSKKLPSYMRIKGFLLHNEPLPKTRLGKFKRFMIKDMLLTRQKKERTPDPALQTEKGRIIEEIVRSLNPDLKNIHLSDHLELDLGMDSLKRIEFATSLEKRFSITITDQILQKWHTIKDVLEDIERLSSLPEIQKTSVQEHGWLFKTIRYFILRIAYLILRSIFKIFFGLGVHGMENIPSPPFIITPNHTSYLDGFVLFASLPFRLSKNLYFQGLRKYFPCKTISELINVIPVSTESDLINAMERSKESLRKGFPLCIFPEGGRSFDGELRELKIGFAILSIEMDVPVIPVLIDGTFKILPRGRFLPRRGRIRVYIDKPLLPSHGFEKAENLRDELRNRMVSLKERLSLP